MAKAWYLSQPKIHSNVLLSQQLETPWRRLGICHHPLLVAYVLSIQLETPWQRLSICHSSQAVLAHGEMCD